MFLDFLREDLSFDSVSLNLAYLLQMLAKIATAKLDRLAIATLELARALGDSITTSFSSSSERGVKFGSIGLSSTESSLPVCYSLNRVHVCEPGI